MITFKTQQHSEVFLSVFEGVEALVSRLESPEVRAWEHGDVEKLIQGDSTEVPRQLLQGHFDLLGLTEKRLPQVKGADGVIRTHCRKDCHLRAIMEPYSESESSLRTTLLYTNMTGQAVYNALVEKGWTEESLPTVRTISNILNRQDYRLRTVAKTKVQKNAETDAIFENVRRLNEQADADTESLRISIDTKATIHVGEYSREGRSRGSVAVKALDHDMCPKEKWVPGGILEPVSGKYSRVLSGANISNRHPMKSAAKPRRKVRHTHQLPS